ncbi:hypothetical protein M427DRAFT_313659 [Gonapodya prolifera JEL478]|uniref:Uncharacterized protein n=1 Tax=Gonapodya prolifera (strain JEL478) TaxID=1344416 RepID=A0A139AWX6_GONPJ|nr:hypothetical protein M427DRAFT_313659 [Gonapodya prolifera JEL478]|eukprot:KXS21207.1 hypothetical protein M427DRAFT_313659 [Gonapodya prolifera JEL478]
MSDRIGRLEQQLADSRSDAERARREGRSAASELAALRAQVAAPPDSPNLTSDMHSRLSSATRQVHSLSATLTRVQSESAASREAWSRERDELTRRVELATMRARRAEQEAEQCKAAQREAMTRLVDAESVVREEREKWDAEREQAAQKEGETTAAREEKMARLEREVAVAQRERDEASAAHAGAMEQYRIAARRWESESLALAARYEAALREAKERWEAADSSRRIAEAECEKLRKLVEAATKHGEAERRAAMEAADGARECAARLREAEQKVKDAATREKMWREERKRVMEDADRAVIERERMVREVDRMKSVIGGSRRGVRRDVLSRSGWNPVTGSQRGDGGHAARDRADVVAEKLAFSPCDSSEFEGDGEEDHFLSQSGLMDQINRVKRRSENALCSHSPFDVYGHSAMSPRSILHGTTSPESGADAPTKQSPKTSLAMPDRVKSSTPALSDDLSKRSFGLT